MNINFTLALKASSVLDLREGLSAAKVMPLFLGWNSSFFKLLKGMALVIQRGGQLPSDTRVRSSYGALASIQANVGRTNKLVTAIIRRRRKH